MYRGAEMAQAISPERLGMGADVTPQRGPGTSIQGSLGTHTVPSPEAIQPSSLRRFGLVRVGTNDNTKRGRHA